MRLHTSELFRSDAYRNDFEARVMHVGRNYAVLDQTCFFPRSCDQVSDLGSIESLPVRGVERVDGEIRHVLDELDCGALALGDLVVGKVNWERRYRTMRLHTALHLFTVAVRSTHEGIVAVPSVVTPWRAVLEVSVENHVAELDLAVINRWIQTTVAEELRVVHEPDLSVEGRLHWHIDGLASIACSGTHVRSTKEVGEVETSTRDVSNGTLEVNIELADEDQA